MREKQRLRREINDALAARNLPPPTEFDQWNDAWTFCGPGIEPDLNWGDEDEPFDWDCYDYDDLIPSRQLSDQMSMLHLDRFNV